MSGPRKPDELELMSRALDLVAPALLEPDWGKRTKRTAYLLGRSATRPSTRLFSGSFGSPSRPGPTTCPSS